MIWIIIFIVIACVLLPVAGFLFTTFFKSDRVNTDPLIFGLIATAVALIILGVCSWRFYVKGKRRGYPTSLNNISSDQIYKFFGQIQGSKKLVVFLENAEGRIRCATVSEAMDPNTKYVKRVSSEKEVIVKEREERLIPVSKE